MNITEIPIYNFQDLLIESVGAETKFDKVEIKNLTAPGENYGSLILAIKLEIRNNQDEEDNPLNIVAKIVPSNEFLQNFMNIPYTFRNEFGFYKTIIPCLERFEKEQTGYNKFLKMFPKFYGGRLSLDSSKQEADKNAVILLENLKVKDYFLPDRKVGFGFDASKLILKKLAEFHGVTLALKTKRFDLFEKNLMPYFEQFQVCYIEEGSFLASPLATKAILEQVKDDQLCSLHMNKINDAIILGTHNLNLSKNSPIFRTKLFATLVHGDVWVNNIMVKTQKHKIIDVKLVDLQLYEYTSITKDVLFFLFTSVQDQVLRDNLDELISFHYNHLYATLKELNCDDIEKFSFEAFQTEMKEVANEISFLHLTMVQNIVSVEDKDTRKVEEIDKNQMFHQIEATSTSSACKNKVRLIAREFIKRGWI